ncbi:hypothetical protein, partial [Komagataeibacter oboediens]|uniref:hypothetical protein n=1 Tax=Komagataeibacter oboediens TaxID=65958 RepID=UPI001F1BDEC6
LISSGSRKPMNHNLLKSLNSFSVRHSDGFTAGGKTGSVPRESANASPKTSDHWRNNNGSACVTV